MERSTAAVKGSKDIVSMLVGFGVDLECQDNEGHACPVAFGSGGWRRRWTVEVVVGKGANVKAKSSPAGATLSV
ncbi:hypothetical protein D5086_016021 [Populus alba]|uniref:Uncharacterized protein n=1 Tax=Populus alba TaxID=43335 RepID=A0ACC4BT47_POPAL